jgi:adenine-specific DNA-methyltransferase
MKNDQVFTPSTIVTKMLDMVGYVGDDIRTKTIFEPSFGGGAFLTQIVERIFEYSETNRLTADETIAILNNVYGVELDPVWYEKTVSLLNEMCVQHGIQYEWKNLICDDTTKLQITQQYDFIVANPPYIKVWDIGESDRVRLERCFEFCKGNTDMYVVFFELGAKALKHNGKMCYITPNSFLRNSSQKELRKWLAKKEIVDSIIDYGTVPVFGKIATYTAITLLDMSGGHKETTYTMMKDINQEEWTNTLNLSKFGDNPWSVVCSSDELFLKEIETRKTKLSDLCDIQYGLATNADKVYLVDKNEVSKFESEILRPVIKGSTLDSERSIIFPYEFDEKTKKYLLIEEERLRNAYPKTYRFLTANKTKLEIRDLEKNSTWYQYGRSQGIQNSRQSKLIIKHVVAHDDKCCQIADCDEQTLVYSGVFIVVKNDKDVERVKKALISEEFCKYVKLVGKNMAGGYKSFNTAVIKNFGIKENEYD